MRSIGLPIDAELQRFALPSGFSYVVDDDTSVPIEPVLFWLTTKFRPKRGGWNPSTVEGLAHDLCDWWRYLKDRGIYWKHVDQQAILEFRDELFSSISARTRRPLGIRTIAKKLRSIIDFYVWAKKRYESIDVELLLDTKRIRIRSFDRDALAHIGPSTRKGRGSTLIPRVNSQPDEHVNPFSRTNWLRVAKLLGPLPSEADSYHGPSRDRLAAEFSLWTGARVGEVAGLTINQILATCCGDMTDASLHPIKLFRTKGNRPRNILVPGYILNELVRYIDGERKEAMVVGKKYGLDRDHGMLFVNGVAARHDSGRPVSPKTLSRSFGTAVDRAGLTRQVPMFDPLTGDECLGAIRAHVFHDLRHTFAVCLYEAEVAAGNSEPWKIVQARLGHKNLSTTVDIYLRVVDVYRTTISDHLFRHLRKTFGTATN